MTSHMGKKDLREIKDMAKRIRGGGRHEGK